MIETEVVKIQLRRGTSLQFDAMNPLLSLGEAGYETDTAKLKVGNGLNNYRDLPYVNKSITDALLTTIQYQQGEITDLQSLVSTLQSDTSDLPQIRTNIATNTSNITINQQRMAQNFKWTAFTLAQGANANHSFSVTNKMGKPFMCIISGDQNPTTATSWNRVMLQKNGTTICQQIGVSQHSSQNLPFCLTYLDTGVTKGTTYTYNFRIEQASGTAVYGEEGGNLSAPQCSVWEV